MAKAAKAVEAEISERMANKFVKDILEHFEAIETAKGKYMNLARRERDGMQTIYEGLAAKGIPQKAAKTNIKIVRAMERIRGWLADLEADDRRMAQKLAKMQGDKKQLLLFADLPKAEKAEKPEKAAKVSKPVQTDLVEAAAAGSA
jgi:hypothetical protein